MFSTHYDEVLPPSGTSSAHVAARAAATLERACPQWRDAVRDYVKQVSEQDVSGSYVTNDWRGRGSRARDAYGRGPKIGRADRATGVALLTGNPTMLLELAIASGAAANQPVSYEDMLSALTKLAPAPFVTEGPKSARVTRTHLMPHQRPRPDWLREAEANGYRHTNLGFDLEPVNTVSLLESYVLDASDMLLADDLDSPVDVTGGRVEVAELLGEAARIVSAGRMLDLARGAVSSSLRSAELPDAMRDELAARADALKAEYEACSTQAVKTIAAIISASSVYEQLRSSHAKMLEQASRETAALSNGAAALDAAEQALGAAAGARALTGQKLPEVKAGSSPVRASGTSTIDAVIDVPNVDVLEVAMYSGAPTATVQALADALKAASPSRSSEQAAAGAYKVINLAIGQAGFPEEGLAWLKRNLGPVTQALAAGLHTQEAVRLARHKDPATSVEETLAEYARLADATVDSIAYTHAIDDAWPIDGPHGLTWSREEMHLLVMLTIERTIETGQLPDEFDLGANVMIALAECDADSNITDIADAAARRSREQPRNRDNPSRVTVHGPKPIRIRVTEPPSVW